MALVRETIVRLRCLVVGWSACSLLCFLPSWGSDDSIARAGVDVASLEAEVTFARDQFAAGLGTHIEVTNAQTSNVVFRHSAESRIVARVPTRPCSCSILPQVIP